MNETVFNSITLILWLEMIHQRERFGFISYQKQTPKLQQLQSAWEVEPLRVKAGNESKPGVWRSLNLSSFIKGQRVKALDASILQARLRALLFPHPVFATVWPSKGSLSLKVGRWPRCSSRQVTQVPRIFIFTFPFRPILILGAAPCSPLHFLHA